MISIDELSLSQMLHGPMRHGPISDHVNSPNYESCTFVSAGNQVPIQKLMMLPCTEYSVLHAYVVFHAFVH